MTAAQHHGSANPRAASIQTYARIAGILFLVSIVGGGFGEFYAPSTLIVPGDATATAHHIIASDLLFRLGFVGYLAEAVSDVALTFVLYVLLRPVHVQLAKLAVLFRIMATATFAFGELFYFAPSLILAGMSCCSSRRHMHPPSCWCRPCLPCCYWPYGCSSEGSTL